MTRTTPTRIALAALTLVATIGAAASAVQAQGSGGTVRGTVVETGSLRPLSGAQVSIPGTTRGTLTNARGEFLLTAVPTGSQRVRAAMIGFTAGEQQVSVVADGTATVSFQLSPTAVELDEVVVTGTAGGTQRRALGNVVNSVNAAQVTEAAPIRSAAELLQGRAPGLTLMQPSGTPGTSTNIRIRGAGSLSAGNQPVFYVDGVRITAGGQSGFSVSGQSTSALDAINPDDIESIEVIKGPAAATLYGADAAAGVIQIITKRGQRGQQSVRFTGRVETGQSTWGGRLPDQYGFCTPARIRQANTIQAGTGVFTAGSYPGCVGIDSLAPAEQRVLVSNLLRDDPRAMRTGDVLSYTLSARGGGENYNFYVSGDRDEEQGIFANSEFARNTGRANFSVFPSNNLDISVSASYARSNTRLPNNDNSSWGILRNTWRSPAGRQGTFEQGFLGLAPDQINIYDNRTRAERALFGSTVNYRPTEWFRNRLNLGLDWNQRLNTLFFPIDRGSPAAYGTTNARGIINQFAPNTRNWTVDYAGTVALPLNTEVSSETSFGMQLNAYRFESLQANGTGLLSNAVRLFSNAEERVAFESFSEQNSVGFFVQQQMGWRNRLFVTGALRFDDNSAFGSQFNRVVYPKAQLSWVVSEEPFFGVGAVDQLRLRGAWGRAGNAPSPFAADRTWGTSNVVLEDGSIAGGLSASAFGNPELRAETGQELELGFDASILNDRLGVEFTYYNQQTRDALLNVPVAPSSGFTGSQLQNVGEIRNSGIEISFFGSPISLPRVVWDARVGFSTNNNRLVSFGGTREEPIPVGFRGSQRHAEGYPLGHYWGIPVARDANGELILTPQGWAALSSDSVFVGSSVPTREASMTNTITIMRNLSLYTFMDYKGGHYLFNMGGQTAESDGVSWHAVNPARLEPGCTSTACQQAREEWRIRQSDSNMMFFERADFVKLRELSLTYRVPTTVTQRIGTGAGLSLTFAGRNLHTWTGYSGVDPEVNISGDADFTRADYMSVPPTRRWIATVNVNF
jgi:TonB-dependent starch-binding outer membrane protein SusC